MGGGCSCLRSMAKLDGISPVCGVVDAVDGCLPVCILTSPCTSGCEGM